MDPKVYAQLLEIFKAELDENLKTMTDCLLALEKGYTGTELVDDLFRSAHTVKGASHSLGLEDIGALSHQLETLFSAVRSGMLKINKNIVNTVLMAMDCIKDSALAAVSGEQAGFDLTSTLNEINKHLPEGGKSEQKLGKKAEKQKTEQKPENAAIPETANETIRVSLSKIELVATLADELQGEKLRNDDIIERLEKFINSLRTRNDAGLSLRNFFYTNHINITAEIESVLNGITEANQEQQAVLSELKRAMRDNNTDLGLIASSMQENIRVMRLVPVSVLLHPLARTVRDIAEDLNKEVNFKIKGDAIEIDRLVLDSLKDPLIHLIRNSIDHGVEKPDVREKAKKPLEGNILIEVNEEGGDILFKVSDDGGGIDEQHVKKIALEKGLITPEEFKTMSRQEALNLIFLPGLSTKDIITDVSGRGVGMDIVLRNVENVKGVLSVESEKGKGTTVNICVPLTLATDRGMLVNVSGQMLIIPTISIWRVLNMASSNVHTLDGKMVISINKDVIPLYSLASTLNLENQKIDSGQVLHVLILHSGASKIAFLVDSFIGEREIAIKSLLPPLSNTNFISGATLSGRGEVILVLSPADVIAAALEQKRSCLDLKEKKDTKKTRILVVEDSITTRTLETDILLNRGFDAKSVANGMEAWGLLQREPFDLVITDIDMPVMNGFELTEKIKKDKNLKNTPVIMVTSMAKESDKRRGVEVGADAYIIKSQFETKGLLTLINDMVGHEDKEKN